MIPSDDRCDVRLRSGRCRERAEINYRANGQNRRLCRHHYAIFCDATETTYSRLNGDAKVWRRVVGLVLAELCDGN